MNAPKLAALLKKHPSAVSATLPESLATRDPIAVLVYSFLLWEANTPMALEAFERFTAMTVDMNDLRVSLPADIVATLGPRYPLAEERALRLKATLNDIFRREHAVRLPPAAAGKRDIRAYVESLEGIVAPFVATRVMLLCYGVHGVPVDERTREVLIEAGVFEPKADQQEISNVLSRHVKAEQSEQTHLDLQACVDQLPVAKPVSKPDPKPDPKPVPKPDPKSAAKPDPKPDPKLDPKPVPKSSAKSAAKPAPAAGVKPIAKSAKAEPAPAAAKPNPRGTAAKGEPAKKARGGKG